MKTNISEEKDNTNMDFFSEAYINADEDRRIELIRAILEDQND